MIPPTVALIRRSRRALVAGVIVGTLACIAGGLVESFTLVFGGFGFALVCSFAHSLRVAQLRTVVRALVAEGVVHTTGPERCSRCDGDGETSEGVDWDGLPVTARCVDCHGTGWRGARL